MAVPGDGRIDPKPRRAAAALLLVQLSALACVHYQARPIAPEAALNALEGRTLEDPELERFLKSRSQAQEWPPRAWDLQALTLVAFYYHPDLEAARSNWAAARAGVIKAGERPNPQLNGGPGYNSTTPKGEMTPWILSLGLDLTLETAGKRGHRIAAARQLGEAARFNVATVAWQVRSRLRRALLEVHAATGTAALLERQIEIQQANVALLERQLNAGEISSFELTQARLLLDGARLALHDAQRRRAESYVQVAGALGVTTRALDRITLGLESFQEQPRDLPEPALRRQALLNRPDVLGSLAEYEAAQANLQLEIARQYPDLHLGPGYQMDQTDNKWALGLSGLLPIFNRNRGAIAETEARRAEAAARFSAVQSRALEEIEVVVAGYQAALAKMATADALLADLRKQEQVTERRWRAGEISRLELGTLQLEIASSELARFEALVKAHEALGQLEDTMQSPADLPPWLATSPRTDERTRGAER